MDYLNNEIECTTVLKSPRASNFSLVSEKYPRNTSL